MSMNEEYQTLTEQTSLTEEEKARAEAFAGEIDLYDSNAVLQYGSGVQKRWRIF